MARSWFVRLALAVMALAIPATIARSQIPDATPSIEKPQILFLEGNHLALPLPFGIVRGVTETLGAGGVSFGDIFIEQLDLIRVASAEHRSDLAQMLRHKLAGKHIAVIITDSPQAFDFLAAEGKDLFPDAAVLSIIPPSDVRSLG